MANPKTGYIPYIDGARGIAIGFVVLSHAGLGKIIPGKFGVTLFFFLSGYLKFNQNILKFTLAIVLLMASVKLILT